MSVAPGQTLLHYRLLDKIGAGGMGEVWLARDTTLDRDVAVKILPEALSNKLCSLMPHVDRLCMVAEMTLDRSGHVEKTELYDAVMNSHARLTYTRVAKPIEGEPDEEQQPHECSGKGQKAIKPVCSHGASSRWMVRRH